ncbi:hypothetical protein ACJ41O_006257 [Fusarium nematophilum]
MAILTDLPDEILECIIVHTSDLMHDTLLELALASKRLSKVVTPMLVRRWSGGPPLECLLLHLFQHPELRARVKHLRLHCLSTACEQHGGPSELGIRDDHLQDLAIALSDAWPVPPEWPELMRNGLSDVFGALLLCWATKLASLDLVVPFFQPEDHDDFVFLQMVGQAVQQFRALGPGPTPLPLPLLELRSVAFRHWDTELSTDGRYAAPFFHLPKMKVFFGFKLGMFDPAWREDDDTEAVRGRYMIDFPVGTSPIEELILEDADISIAGLSTLVGACRRLKTLVFQPGPVLENQELSSTGLAQAILLQKASLEILMIDFERNGLMEIYESADEEGSVGLEECFQYLERLESLTIDAYTLFKECSEDEAQPTPQDIVGRLPPSLIHLRLEQIGLGEKWASSREQADEYLDGLESFLRECRPDGKFPKFRYLDVAECWSDDECFVRLEGLAAAQRVQLSFDWKWRSIHGVAARFQDLQQRGNMASAVSRLVEDVRSNSTRDGEDGK